MGRTELEALLAGMVAGEDSAPTDLTSLTTRLRALGVRVGTEDAKTEGDQGASVRAQDVALSDAGTTGIKPGLDTMLGHMNADQLKSVAKRYHASANAGRVVESKKAVLEALGSAALLDELIGGLSPLERALLSEVKRRGGAADGWALIVHAALQGFRPVERAGAGSIYKDYLGHAPGMGYLGVLLRDGLLMPAGSGAPWFATSHPYAGEPGMDTLFADPRVLARLPDEPPSPPPPLELEPVDVSPTPNHPLGTMLELFDVVQLLTEEGGLQVTQRGAVGKPLLSRLLKRRPRLEGRLERLLNLALALGLLGAPAGSAKDPWRVNLARLHTFQTAPLTISYNYMVEAYLNVAAPDDTWGPRYTGLVSEAVAGGALLQSLALLPDQPVAMEGALDALWGRALKHLSSSRTRRGQGDDTEPERPAWFTGVLLGAFRDLGLVAVAELPDAEQLAAARAADQAAQPARGGLHIMRGDRVTRFIAPSEGDDAYRYAVTPALGFSWFTEGQRLRSTPPPDAKGLRQVGLDTAKPAEPSLLIGANFDILVYLGKLSPPALTALGCADCTRVDAQTASYTLSRGSLYRALESGLELPALLELLGAHSLGVPENVTRSLRDWASRRERLRLREGVTLLEYAGQGERDAALETLQGAEAVAERFILLGDAPPPKVSVRHPYTLPPARTLHFSPAGHFRVEGATDLAGRAVLAQLATRDPDGTHHLNFAAIRAGALTTAARDALTARARGGLPPQVEALINIWEGGDAPTLAKISVFQHPSAAALAKHPGIAPHLGGQLNDASYLVRDGHEGELKKRLADLGVELSEGFAPGVKAQAVGGSAMQSGLDTRKLRALIEKTIAESRSLELCYHREKDAYDGYGYSKKSKGKVVTEKITPEAVVYTGSTPYLTGRTPGKDAYRRVRIGYITEIAVL